MVRWLTVFAIAMRELGKILKVKPRLEIYLLLSLDTNMIQSSCCLPLHYPLYPRWKYTCLSKSDVGSGRNTTLSGADAIS